MIHKRRMCGERLFHFHQFGFVGSGGGFDFEDVDAGTAGGEVDAVGDKGKGLALAEGVDGGDLSDGVRTQVDEDLVAGGIGIEQRLALAGAVGDAHGSDVGVHEVRIHVFRHEAARPAVVGDYDVAESATTQLARNVEDAVVEIDATWTCYPPIDSMKINVTDGVAVIVPLVETITIIS